MSDHLTKAIRKFVEVEALVRQCPDMASTLDSLRSRSETEGAMGQTRWALTERGELKDFPMWEHTPKGKRLAQAWARDVRRERPDLKPVCLVKVRIEVIK